jgi:hypothetical protein
MALLEMLIQMVADWLGGSITDIVGQRAEHAFDKWLKKRRLQRAKKSRDSKQREEPCENKGS